MRSRTLKRALYDFLATTNNELPIGIGTCLTSAASALTNVVNSTIDRLDGHRDVRVARDRSPEAARHALDEPDRGHQRKQRREQKRHALGPESRLPRPGDARSPACSGDLLPHFGVIAAKEVERSQREDDNPAWLDDARHLTNGGDVGLDALQHIE